MKALGLISGGIDSPVAIYLLSKKFDISLVHFDNYPFVSKSVRKRTIKLIKKLKEITKKNFTFYIVPHGKNLEDLIKASRKFTCVLCRRMMYRISNEIAKKKKAKYIITGESLAQVASQTLSNLITEDKASKLPILRPLIGFDKEDIIKISKEIGTYDISIEKGEECPSKRMKRAMCCYATPEHPATKSDLKILNKLEKKVKIEKLINRSLKNIEKTVI